MRRPHAIFALVAVFVLTSCLDGDDDTAGDVTTAAAGSTTTAPVTTVAATSVPATTTTTTPATTTTTTTTAAATGGGGSATTESSAPATTAPATAPATTAPDAAGDCLVGRWVITESELNAYYDSVEAGIPNVTFTITGTTGLEFTDTEYVYTPAFTLELEVAGITGTGETSGTVTGTYTTADGILFSDLTEGAIDIQVDVGGVVMDGSDIGNGLLNTVPFVESAFLCEGPVIMFETTEGGRHPVRLTPAG